MLSTVLSIHLRSHIPHLPPAPLCIFRKTSRTLLQPNSMSRMYFEAKLTRKACVDSSRHRFPCDSDRSGHIFKQFAQEDVGTNSLILHVTSVPASCSLMVAPGILPRGPGSLASFSALTLSPLSVLLAQTCCGTQKQGPLYSYSIILVRPTSQEHASPISNCFLSEFGEGVL